MSQNSIENPSLISSVYEERIRRMIGPVKFHHKIINLVTGEQTEPRWATKSGASRHLNRNGVKVSGCIVKFVEDGEEYVTSKKVNNGELFYHFGTHKHKKPLKPAK